MKSLICEICQGEDLIKNDGVFVCQNCGAKYSVTEARKIMGTSDKSVTSNKTDKSILAMSDDVVEKEIVAETIETRSKSKEQLPEMDEFNKSTTKYAFLSNHKLLASFSIGILVFLIIIVVIVNMTTRSNANANNAQVIQKQTLANNDETTIHYAPVDPATNILITNFVQNSFVTSYGENTYKVGSDIPAGKYVAFGPQSYTAFAKIFGDSSKSNCLNSGYNWTNHLMFVDLSEGQYLEIDGCFLVPFDELKEKGLAKFGIFIGGDTLPVGEYRLDVADKKNDGFYKVYSDYKEDMGINYRYFPATQYITVTENQIYVFQNAKISAPSKDVSFTTIAGKSSNDKFDLIYQPNTYRVGIDIPPGVYILYGPQKWTVLLRVTDTSIVKEDFYGNSFNSCLIVDLKAGEYVDVDSDSYMVPLEEIQKKEPSVTGIYHVGKDIEAGEYKLIANDSKTDGYWALYTELNLDTLKKYNYFENQEYVTISNAAYFVLQNASYEKQ